MFSLLFVVCCLYVIIDRGSVQVDPEHRAADYGSPPVNFSRWGLLSD